jgi:hypothetical protein
LGTGSRILSGARLDLLRGPAGAEKLLFTQELRQSIFDTNDPIFQPVTRCPADIFLTIGNVLSHGKGYLDKSVPVERFEYVPTESGEFLREWDEDQDTVWKRHVSLLRIMKFPDTFLIPSSKKKIQITT